MGQFIVSARKYRPNSFETLIGQENIARTLKNSILRDQLAHAYLFCGPRGVGKTSTARIFAKTINCSNPSAEMEPCGECESCRAFAEGRSYNIHELDAASNNSVDDIRSLTDKVRIPPQIGKYSVYIIDEVHMLTQSAFNAFLKTLEEPPAYAIFILATTEKHKILPTILSRCQTYDFNRIGIEDIVKNLRSIAAQENVAISEDAMHIIAQKADGAMRDALTLFDQTVAFCGREVTYDQVISNLNVLDYAYYFRLTDNFLQGDYATALLIFDEILNRGFNAHHFISGLSSHFRDLIVCRSGASQTLLEIAPTVARTYCETAQKCSTDFLFEALNIASTCEAQYKQSGNPRLLIEFALMKLCRILPAAASVFSATGGQPAASPAPAPASAPVPAPAPVPVPVVEPGTANDQTIRIAKAPRHPSGPSIKDMMREASVPASASSLASSVPSDTVATQPAQVPAAPVTEERVLNVWPKLIEGESAPNLKATLSTVKPTVDEAKGEIHFEVRNSAQKDWIDRNRRLRLEDILRSELSAPELKFIVDVAPVFEDNSAQKLYMPTDKDEYLSRHSEEYRNLKSDFELEVK